MQDNLLIAFTDLKDIAGQFSDNIEAKQVDPYILEAQTGEIRRFLGDELYLELLTGFTVGEVAGFYDSLLVVEGRWIPGFGGGNVWESGIGWNIAFIGAPAIEKEFASIPDTTYVGFIDIDVGTGSGDTYNVELYEADGTTLVTSDTVVFTASGRFAFTLVSVAGKIIRITSQGAAGTSFITGFSLDGLLNEERFFELMDGLDYTNQRSQLVRFNGLSEVLKYWSCYRYIRSADILMMRFGNRIAEDGIYSSGATREQVKATVYNQKNQALKFQTDADDFIETFPETYPSFTNNIRIPKRNSFELNKLPQGSRGHRHFFATDDHRLNRR